MTERSVPSKLGKTQRQYLVARLIEAQPVANQAALVELLAAEGVSAPHWRPCASPSVNFCTNVFFEGESTRRTRYPEPHTW